MVSESALTFEPQEHRYFYGNREVPAVSRVLEPLQELDGIPRAVLERARTIGQYVHEAVNLDIHKALEWTTLDPQIVGYVRAARRFREEQEVRILVSEHRLGSAELGVAGTLDVLGLWRKLTWVIDWKATESMPRTTGPQTAAYDYLYRKSFGGRAMRRAGVQLFADTTYKVFEFSDSRDWNVFLSALNIWHWRNG